MKFRVTPELAKTFKALRVQKGVTSRDVAEHLGKSPSYVSKLEGGDVKFITSTACTSLLEFVAGSDDFYGEVLPMTVDVLQLVSERGTLREQLWLMHYDVSERPVEVSEDMARELSDAFADLGLSCKEVAEEVNSNPDSDLSERFPANEFVLVEDDDGGHRLLARAEIEEPEVEAILGEKGHVATYFHLYNIVHTLLRVQLYPGVKEKLPPDDAAKLLRLTSDYLNRWGVNSLMGFSQFISSDEFIDSQIPMVGAERGVVDKVASQLREISEHDALDTAIQLDAWSETLEWDPAFALKLVGIPFSSLGTLSHTNKMQLLEEIEALVDRYDQMDDFEKRVERY